MSKVKNIIFIIIGVVLFGCASQPKRIIETESGRPEIIIKTTNMDVVRSLLTSNMGEEEWNYFLIDNSEHNLTFARQVKAGEEADKAQEMVGTHFGTIPERVVVFNIMRIQDTIKTIAYPSLMSLNGFGKTKQVGLENYIPIFNALQELLISTKSKIESDLMLNLIPQ
ncbi:MAG: hypothetical protein HN472_10125 [Nitrospina sp.]|nr:hypothetical protein [Nitrospina sp.]MBT3874486.1 hypothetical protein [Nitrospina sp.]MBT4049119.1 hypothetical protein [Nitrospina sp.]MBT4559157.1 hypothetical protein [Nitrospina sp.]MBT5347823.1 hypothetical protein [Nitrospina sp.]